jgi:hypothetical protein
MKSSRLTSEYTLFLILQAWANANEGDKDDGGLDSMEAEAGASRKRTAEQITNYISLECISPADLSTHYSGVFRFGGGSPALPSLQRTGLVSTTSSQNIFGLANLQRRGSKY